jgi:MFS transporter, PAT family, beta-lactamase induction signal transducer AmpG
LLSTERVGPSKTKALLVCVFLGFSSGLPLFILYNLLSAWLKSEGVDLKAIGLFALVGIPYTWKFLWSPAMDRFQLPFLGRRRGWIIATQIAVMLAVMLMGQFNPSAEIWTVVFLAAIVAFFSASQDIVIDAHRREWLAEEQMGSGTALFVNAYKLSTLVPGSLSLILSDIISWDWVFFITGLFMLPGILTTLLVSEPRMYGPAPKTLREAVVEPFNEFVNRRGWRHALLILAFIFLYKLGDSMATALATPFYLELGFTRTEIGLVAKNAGLWASILGGMLGAYWMLKTGVNRGLWIFGIFQALATLGFVILAQTGADLWVLTWVIGFEAITVGLGTAAFTAYIALETNPRFTATQFALFTSLSAVPRTFINALTGYIVEVTGWTNFFILCFALAIPGLLLLPKIAPWNKEKKSEFQTN